MCFYTLTWYDLGRLRCTPFPPEFGRHSYWVFCQKLWKRPAVKDTKLFLSLLHTHSRPLDSDAIEFDASRCNTLLSEMQKSWWSVPLSNLRWLWRKLCNLYSGALSVCCHTLPLERSYLKYTIMVTSFARFSFLFVWPVIIQLNIDNRLLYIPEGCTNLLANAVFPYWSFNLLDPELFF